MISKGEKNMRFKTFEIDEALLEKSLDHDHEKYNFEIVKWDDDILEGVIIGYLRYDRQAKCFNFESYGLAYFEYREDGLEEWLLKWCELKEIEYEYNK